MSSPIQCPECSASNPPGSSWCNLCFARFGSTEAETDLADPNPGPERLEADLAAPTNPPPPPRPPEGEQLALLDIGEEEDTKLWTCRFCDTKNPVGSDYCTACQQPIYHSFGGQPAAVEVEPMDALRRSAVPGGGLILLKQGILGGTILALTVISLIAGVYLLRLGVVAYGAALVFVGLDSVDARRT
jgi:ribosomal protein L40E